MAYERIWPAVSRPFLTNGTARGTFTVDDYTGFYVNQLLNLTSTTQPLLQVKIKRIDEDGTIHVGRPDKGIEDRADVSAYLVADNAIATAPEQRIPTMKPEDIVQAVYERDPVKAVRTLSVDAEGKSWSDNNPLPTKKGGVNLTPKAGFNRVVIVRDVDGNPTQYQFFKNTTQTGYIDVTYDVDGNAIEYKGTDLS